MTGAVRPFAGHPYSGVYKTLQIEPGDLLCRVWDRAAGNTHHFDATSWNPTRKAQSDVTAGRFDPLSPATTNSGFLYGSQAGDGGEKVAILETFRSMMLRDAVRGGRIAIHRNQRARRSIRYFEVIEPIELVNINQQSGRECFRMDEEVLYVHDRPATRTWGDAVKSYASDAAGIAYNSTRESLFAGKHSFILWEDRAPNPGFNTVNEVSFDTPAGRALVDEALEDYNVFWV